MNSKAFISKIHLVLLIFLQVKVQGFKQFVFREQFLESSILPKWEYNHDQKEKCLLNWNSLQDQNYENIENAQFSLSFGNNPGRSSDDLMYKGIFAQSPKSEYIIQHLFSKNSINRYIQKSFNQIDKPMELTNAASISLQFQLKYDMLDQLDCTEIKVQTLVGNQSSQEPYCPDEDVGISIEPILCDSTYQLKIKIKFHNTLTQLVHFINLIDIIPLIDVDYHSLEIQNDNFQANRNFQLTNPRFNQYKFKFQIFNNDTYILKVVQIPENIEIFSSGSKPQNLIKDFRLIEPDMIEASLDQDLAQELDQQLNLLNEENNQAKNFNKQNDIYMFDDTIINNIQKFIEIEQQIEENMHMVINRNKKQDGNNWLNQHSGKSVKGIGIYVRESGDTSSGPLIDDIYFEIMYNQY